MLLVACSSCSNQIVVKPMDRPPPWCPRCGADLKERPSIAPQQETRPVAGPKTAIQSQPPPFVSLSPEDMRQETPLRWSDPMPGTKAPLPAWACVFAIACGAIPFVTLGGAIPVMIGFGGASGCLTVARKRALDPIVRIGMCMAITAGCWGIIIVLFAAVLGWFF